MSAFECLCRSVWCAELVRAGQKRNAEAYMARNIVSVVAGMRLIDAAIVRASREMRDYRPFRCAECGEPVTLQPGKHRTRCVARDVHLPIPDGFMLPTCSHCGELYVNKQDGEKIDVLLRSALEAASREMRGEK